MRRNCVGLAGPADQEAVNGLRLETYSAAPEFRLLRPDLLAWEAHDPSCIVLGGWDDAGRLVATIQCRAAGSAAHAEAMIGASVEMAAACFPAVVMGRAATAPGRTGRGLNSVLRWYCLTAARDVGFRSALGLAYQGAPRMRTMEAMGYNLRQPARVWDPEVEPKVPPIVAFLHQADFDAALDYLWPLAGEQVAAYPWQGPTLSLRLFEKMTAP
jgi:GNAT superfamily N-acetyltransferase